LDFSVPCIHDSWLAQHWTHRSCKIWYLL
jgi:hypothetical protein